MIFLTMKGLNWVVFHALKVKSTSAVSQNWGKGLDCSLLARKVLHGAGPCLHHLGIYLHNFIELRVNLICGVHTSFGRFLTGQLKTNSSFQSSFQSSEKLSWEPDWRFSLEVRTAQVLTWHPIWKLDRFSHFEKGPVLMVKKEK